MKKINLAENHATAHAGTGTCSFDVFDTFLVRRCTTPDGVFERAFQLSPVSKTHPNARTSYVQHRIEAGARARHTKTDKLGISEVGIDEIYAQFPFRLFGLDPADLPTLVQAEFEAELDLCRTNTEILRLYREMRQSGRRTGFISDTYWNSAQLAKLLRTCQPDLEWDFLYASCDAGTNKSEDLFLHYLKDQAIDPAEALHIGDNQYADIKGARSHGIRARHYPQASPAFAAQLVREDTLAELLYAGQPWPLDQGLRTFRRVVAARAPQKSNAFHLGVTTLGPVMCAYDAFLADRVAQLRAQGRRAAVAFLGRDGYLSHQIWHQTRNEPAAYLEINRRVTVVGSASTLDPLVDLFERIPKIDASTFADMLKLEVPSVTEFLASFKDGTATGKELAEALPLLLDETRIGELAARMRKDILAHLRAAISDFDECTDIVLADLGYSGNIQKSLRRVFDCEGIATRLHGVYVLTRDDMLQKLAKGDTAEGFISDLVVTPHVKRMLMRNIFPLEHLCCSPVGSVRCYEDGKALRESDPRPPAQLELCEQAQLGALFFAAALQDGAPAYNIAPFSNLETAARWTTVILGRMVLLPTDDELVLIGSFQHDINLGTTTLAPMVDAEFVERLQIAAALPAACTAPPPPMWLAGCFSSLSPAHAYLYTLFGANKLPAGIFADVKCGQAQIGLFAANGTATLKTVPCYRTGLGDLRIRVAISSRMQIRTIVVPVAAVADEGLIDGVVAQAGKTIQDASFSLEPIQWPAGKLRSAGMERSGRYYRATSADACLIIDVDPGQKPFLVFSIALRTVGKDRILALGDNVDDRRFALEDLTAAAPQTRIAPRENAPA